MNTDKTDAVELLTDAELDTALEVAKSAEVDEYVKTLQWSGDIDDYTKTLVIGNIRGYALRKTTPETPINKFINSLVGKVSQLTAENDRLKKEVEAANDLQATLIKNACTDEYCKDEEDNNLAAEYGIPHDSTTCACPCHEMEDAISVALEGDSK